MRTVFLLASYDLCDRVFKIWCLQILLIFSPLNGIQSNFKIYFDANTCTYETTVDGFKTALESVATHTTNSINQVANSINSASEGLQSSMDWTQHIADALEKLEPALEQIEWLYGECVRIIENLSASCASVVPETCDDLLSSTLCYLTTPTKSACDGVASRNLCEPLAIASQLKTPVADARKGIESFNNELMFHVSVVSNVTTSYNKTNLENIKANFQQSFLRKIDLFVLVKRLNGFAIAVSLVLLTYKKNKLLTGFLEKKRIKIDDNNGIWWCLNPYAIQLFILISLGIVDLGVRSAYDIHKEQLMANPINLRLEGNAGIASKSGGQIGTFVLGLIGEFTDLSMFSFAIDFEKCYDQSLGSVAFHLYCLIAVMSIFGIWTSTFQEKMRKMDSLIMRLSLNDWTPYAPNTLASVFKRDGCFTMKGNISIYQLLLADFETEFNLTTFCY